MFEKMISKIIGGCIVLFMSAMIALAFLQIVLRNFFSSGISWADVTVRHLVLWVGFFGAILASVRQRHITLDVFSRGLPERAKRYVGIFIHLCSSGVCFLLAYASYKFVAGERLMGEALFGGVPVWLAQVIIPITFGLMGLLFFVRTIKEGIKF